jgi:hypothetical protein
MGYCPAQWALALLDCCMGLAMMCRGPTVPLCSIIGVSWRTVTGLCAALTVHAAATTLQTGAALKQLRQALAAGLKLPDTVFLYYTGDWSVCSPGPDNPCTVPIVSHIKSWGGSQGKQTDLLVPQLKLVHSMLYHWPPRDKLPVGEQRPLLACLSVHQQGLLPQQPLVCNCCG